MSAHRVASGAALTALEAELKRAHDALLEEQRERQKEARKAMAALLLTRTEVGEARRGKEGSFGGRHKGEQGAYSGADFVQGGCSAGSGGGRGAKHQRAGWCTAS